MRDVDTEQPLEGGMNVQMWLSHTEEVQPQVDLQRTIWDALHSEHELEIEDVNVQVDDFVAELTGWVPSYAAKLRVQRAAERVPGIRAVTNELEVRLPVKS